MDLKNHLNLFLTDMSPGPGHPDGALRGGHPVHVPLGPDAHAGSHREGGLQTLLNGPLHLLDVLEILRNKMLFFIYIIRYSDSSVTRKCNYILLSKKAYILEELNVRLSTLHMYV